MAPFASLMLETTGNQTSNRIEGKSGAMEGIVLAGGFGTRLRQVVPDLPKAMAPVSGRPFLEIVLAGLSGKGFRRLVLSLGYMAETVVRHFGDRFAQMDLVYEIEDRPLGTGGALRRAPFLDRDDMTGISSEFRANGRSG